MTPTAPELLAGCAAALAAPPAEGDEGAFLMGKVGLVALIAVLASQEAGTGAAVRAAENARLRELLADAASVYGAGFAEPVNDGDLSLAALDAANAELRRRLIRLHEAVEDAKDGARDRQILSLYREMAQARLLHLPPMSSAS